MEPDAPPPPSPQEPAAPPTPVPPRQRFPTWKQGFVLCLGGLALFVSACFGCFFTLNARGNSTNEPLTALLAIVAIAAAVATLVGMVFLFMRILGALFGTKDRRPS